MIIFSSYILKKAGNPISHFIPASLNFTNIDVRKFPNDRSTKKQFDLFEDHSSTDLTLSTVGKMLRLSPQQFIKTLSDQKMIFKGKASQAWEAYQSYVEKGFFRHHTVMIRHNSGELITHI